MSSDLPNNDKEPVLLYRTVIHRMPVLNVENREGDPLEVPILFIEFDQNKIPDEYKSLLFPPTKLSESDLQHIIPQYPWHALEESKHDNNMETETVADAAATATATAATTTTTTTIDDGCQCNEKDDSETTKEETEEEEKKKKADLEAFANKCYSYFCALNIIPIVVPWSPVLLNFMSAPVDANVCSFFQSFFGLRAMRKYLEDFLQETNLELQKKASTESKNEEEKKKQDMAKQQSVSLAMMERITEIMNMQACSTIQTINTIHTSKLGEIVCKFAKIVDATTTTPVDDDENKESPSIDENTQKQQQQELMCLCADLSLLNSTMALNYIHVQETCLANIGVLRPIILGKKKEGDSDVTFHVKISCRLNAEYVNDTQCDCDNGSLWDATLESAFTSCFGAKLHTPNTLKCHYEYNPVAGNDNIEEYLPKCPLSSLDWTEWCKPRPVIIEGEQRETTTTTEEEKEEDVIKKAVLSMNRDMKSQIAYIQELHWERRIVGMAELVYQRTKDPEASKALVRNYYETRKAMMHLVGIGKTTAIPRTSPSNWFTLSNGKSPYYGDNDIPEGCLAPPLNPCTDLLHGYSFVGLISALCYMYVTSEGNPQFPKECNQ